MKLILRSTFVVWLALLAAPACLGQYTVSQVKDINPGSSSANPDNLTVFNGALYFGADGTTGNKLWKSDGTETGTVPVKDISAPFGLTVFNGALYFRANDGSTGFELWKTDGTEAGTVRVKDINPGGGSADPYYFTVFNGALYFQANDGSTGFELWKTDGTEAGTVRVKDIYPGAKNSSPRELTLFNGALYFSANDGPNGYQLWKTDGTEAGTVRVTDINPGRGGAPSDLTVFNGVLYFQAYDSTTGEELWKTDGTQAGTVRIKDIYPGSSGALPSELTVFSGALYFRADDGSTGFELWKTDGTETGTVRVTDIYPGGGSANPFYLTVFNGALYFRANDGTTGQGLWRSDGTAVGTMLVKAINPSGDSYSDHLTVFAGALYFSANDGSAGRELWKSDGTSDGTVRVADLYPGGGSANPDNLTEFNGALYFRANDGSTGEELWKLTSCDAGVVLAPTTPAKLCQGQPLPVTFQAGTCPSPPANAFRIELSNAAGSFASPTTLGYAQPGTTSLALPANLPLGNAYQVRIVTATQTSPPSAPFAVEGPTLSGAMPAVSGTPVCRGGQVTVSFSLPGGGCSFGSGSSFTAQLSNFTGSFGKPLSLGPVVPGQANSLTIPASLVAGSGYRIRVVSGSPAATSSASLPFQIKVCGSRLSAEVAEEAQLVIAPNPVVGGAIRCQVRGMDNPQFELYGPTGRRLDLRVDSALEPGRWRLCPVQVLPPGVYVVEAHEGDQRLTHRVLVAE